MYTISIYFDEKSNKTIQQYINQIAKLTGNTYMVDEQVPPHITLSAFDTKKESEVIELVDNMTKNWNKFPLQWVSVGAFMPYVVYVAPVLNVELYSAATEVYSALMELGDVSIRNCYKPFQWMPHTTLAKMLNEDEMLTAFKLLHNQFGVIKGTACRIAVSKTNPHLDIAVFDIK